MSTLPTDLLVEVREDLIDRALAVAYYTSVLPTQASGRFHLARHLDPALAFVGDLLFEVKLLEPPTVDAVDAGQVRLLLRVRLSLDILEGLGGTFDLTAGVLAKPRLGTGGTLLALDLTGAQVDEIVVDHRAEVPARTRKILNDVAAHILTTDLLDTMGEIDLTPFLTRPELPLPFDGFDALVRLGTEVQLIKGGWVYPVDATTRSVTGPPVPLTTAFPGVWPEGVDAATVLPGGELLFFRAREYLAYDRAGRRPLPGFPAAIADGYPGVWADGIDAVLPLGDALHFFRGSDVIRVAVGGGPPGVPMPITAAFPGLGAHDVCAAVAWDPATAYLFTDAGVHAWNPTTATASGPASLDGWPGFATASLPLPVTPRIFDVLGGRTFAVGVDLFGRPARPQQPLADLTAGNDIWVGIRDDVIQEAFDAEWSHTPTHAKRRMWQGSLSAVGSQKDGWSKTLAGVALNLPQLLSMFLLGLPLLSPVRIDDVQAVASASVWLDEPRFSVHDGDFHVDDITVRAWLALRVSLTWSVWGPRDIEHPFDIGWWPQSDITLLDLTHESVATLDKLAVAVTSGLDTGVSATITDFDLDLRLTGLGVPDDIIDWLVDQVSGLVRPMIPAIRVIPPLLSRTVPISPLSLAIDSDEVDIAINDYVVPAALTLEIDPGPVTFAEGSVSAAASVSVKELPRTTVSVPAFVANRNPRRMEVHRLDCVWVERIDQYHRLGYYQLIDALHDGFDGCATCIPEYHTR